MVKEKQDFHSYPPEALEVVDRLEENQFEAWIVGGAVRDQLLGRPVHDVDITTNARPEEIKEVFADCRTIDVGVAFGTIRVIWADAIFEVTTYRSDGAYEDGRHPTEVTYSDHLSDDLLRRDFTINAMAWNPTAGFVDLYGGREDLKAGIIRAVGQAEDRIHEDALRMLRGIRFATRLNFYLEDSLYQELQRQADRIGLVSVERIVEEMDKILLDSHAPRGLNLLKETDLLPSVIPELSAVSDDVFDLTKRLLENSSHKINLRWAALFRYAHEDYHEAGQLAKKRLTKLHCSKERITTVGFLVGVERIKIKPTLADCRRMMGAWGNHFWDALAFLIAEDKGLDEPSKANLEELQRLASKTESENLATKLSDLQISGKDLMLIGYKQGKNIGDTLADLLELVIEGKVENSYEALMGEAKNNLVIYHRDGGK